MQLVSDTLVVLRASAQERLVVLGCRCLVQLEALRCAMFTVYRTTMMGFLPFESKMLLALQGEEIVGNRFAPRFGGRGNVGEGCMGCCTRWTDCTAALCGLKMFD